MVESAIASKDLLDVSVLELAYAMHTQPRYDVTIRDLYRLDRQQRAEIVGGKLVLMTPTGALPGYVGGSVLVSLRAYERRTKSGYALPDNVGFIVNLPNRRSFSPDVAFYTGPLRKGFLKGPPIFAVEVRSEHKYGRRAEARMAAKRADYFAAGTQVVWDVDPLRDECVKVYRKDDPSTPAIYRRGDVAEAEPALPGWTMPVDEIFPVSHRGPTDESS